MQKAPFFARAWFYPFEPTPNQKFLLEERWRGKIILAGVDALIWLAILSLFF